MGKTSWPPDASAYLDQWIDELPEKTVKENARLSLLHGETTGLRGDWARAMQALRRSRSFFAKKGDARMEALACLKLSTVYNNLGDLSRSSEAAREGLSLAPEDAFATRLRLRGNLAVTAIWLTSAAEAELECKRVAVESVARGYDQYAAVAYHNLGLMLRQEGRLDESRSHLERAARFWDASPRHPFADNSELVTTLLLLGETAQAEAVATAAVARTSPWPRPHGEALYGRACVLVQKGEYTKAEGILRSLLDERRDELGPVAPKVCALLIESYYLSGSGDG